MHDSVGWVERSDTHQLSFRGTMMGFAALYPSYKFLPREHLECGAQLRDPFIAVLEATCRDAGADLIEIIAAGRTLADLPHDRGIAIHQQHETGRIRRGIVSARIGEQPGRLVVPAERQVKRA